MKDKSESLVACFVRCAAPRARTRTPERMTAKETRLFQFTDWSKCGYLRPCRGARETKDKINVHAIFLQKAPKPNGRHK